MTDRESRLTDPWYEQLIAQFRREHHQSVTGTVVIRGDEKPWVQNRNAYVQYLLHPYDPEAAYRHMLVFIHEIHTHGGVHRHQGGLALYVLDGHGYTICEGERSEWQQGDLILLPIRPGGVEHQHVNADPKHPARWLAFITLGFHDFLANDMVQVKNSPDWHGEDPLETEPISQLRGRLAHEIPTSGPMRDGTLLDSLFEMRDADRQRASTAQTHVHGDALRWETNRQGMMRWYMHPRKLDTALRTLVVFQQRIPAGSRSGRQLHPGGIVHYVLRGRGHTMLDGQRHEWRAGDLIALPIRAHGIDYQHFNDDPDQPAEFIVAMPNLFEVLGIDLGGRFEQLESAPEYGLATTDHAA